MGIGEDRSAVTTGFGGNVVRESVGLQQSPIMTTQSLLYEFLLSTTVVRLHLEKDHFLGYSTQTREPFLCSLNDLKASKQYTQHKQVYSLALAHEKEYLIRRSKRTHRMVRLSETL